MIKRKRNRRAPIQAYAKYTHARMPVHTLTQQAKDTQITGLENVTQERRKILHMCI